MTETRGETPFASAAARIRKRPAKNTGSILYLTRYTETLHRKGNSRHTLQRIITCSAVITIEKPWLGCLNSDWIERVTFVTGRAPAVLWPPAHTLRSGADTARAFLARSNRA